MEFDRRRLLAASAAMAGGTLLGRSAFADIALAPPESVGFSSAGLAALNSTMHALVDGQKLAGVTTLVARHGKVVHFDAYGKRDLESGAPMQKDTIFRIASMTKPTIGVAMMMLWEQGKWKLTDRLDEHIPEFKGLKVKAKDGSLQEVKTPATMAQIMSHTAGFGVNNDYTDQRFGEGDLQGMIDKLSRLPLYSQPGTDWAYGPAVDIQGYIVQKLSGQPLDVFMREHLFGPLGMADTGFWVAPEKVGRVARINTYKDGKIVPAQGGGGRDPSKKPTYLSGSGGLLSTTEDYWKFAQMVGNGGISGGRRYLKADTVRLMRKSVLQPGVMVDLYGPDQPGVGFGLDFAVIEDPSKVPTPQGKDTFYWGGAFGTWFWIDPTNDVIFVGMIQNLNGSVPTGPTPNVRVITPRLTYAALTDPKK
ncbi:serine hydrolase domain-containing protein [Phenylobacterium sp.]|uniref:serine hydrolase domain-containing protein n=1 Tax=Phenylobacterium sp. TaxID=1871053 RepID=UPI002BA4119F|nr:serine hydrolase domain-containing protein [Phenylobacterium sp.]HLZ75592.1 serine hydrolase domain-containing protein [Phenylobacterium sp.]